MKKKWDWLPLPDLTEDQQSTLRKGDREFLEAVYSGYWDMSWLTLTGWGLERRLNRIYAALEKPVSPRTLSWPKLWDLFSFILPGEVREAVYETAISPLQKSLDT